MFGKERAHGEKNISKNLVFVVVRNLDVLNVRMNGSHILLLESWEGNNKILIQIQQHILINW